ncbi:ILI1 binding bHLH 1 [Prunus dulcis]|uniref:ILI1 binding bHLH 1 n=1 Tax=Prunus dulcis TaxID=3755 RepID=A0A4Y1S1V6_PRUDU|nr:ILI1 binding bHLH 1 [Prunus dulcis]
MNPKSLSLRPKTSVKSRFTKGFLQALKRIQGQRSRSPNVSSPREMCRRYLSVKIAADASMASAVGSRRAWSRALLTKIRSHGAPRVYKYSAEELITVRRRRRRRSARMVRRLVLIVRRMSFESLCQVGKPWIFAACWMRLPIT